MGQLLNPSLPDMTFLEKIESQKQYKKFNFQNIQNILNFSKSIQNSKLINISVENVEKDPKSEKEIPSTTQDSSISTEPTISDVMEDFTTTESSGTKTLHSVLEDIWTQSSDKANDYEDSLDEHAKSTLFPFKTSDEIDHSGATTLIPDVNSLHATHSLDTFYELVTSENEVVGTTTIKEMKDRIKGNFDLKHIIVKTANYVNTNSYSSNITPSSTVHTDIMKPPPLIDLGSSTTTKTYNAPKQEDDIEVAANYNKNVKDKNVEVQSFNFSTSVSSYPSRTGEKIHQKLSKILIFPSKINKKTENYRPTQNLHIETKNHILIEEESPNIKYDISTSVILSIGISCAFALLLFVLMSLWILRRSRYHSKVYLSYELSKPRTHLTRPMRPSVLPGETIIDNMEVDETDSPREPVYLDQEIIGNPIPLHSKYSISMESCDSGIDNLAFTDASSSEGHKSNKNLQVIKQENLKTRRPTPKYNMSRKKRILLVSSLKVCSSDGSIFPASASLTKCLIPPPPYSPNIRNDSKLSLPSPNESSKKDSINSISEVCEQLPSPSSNDK